MTLWTLEGIKVLIIKSKCWLVNDADTYNSKNVLIVHKLKKCDINIHTAHFLKILVKNLNNNNKIDEK